MIDINLLRKDLAGVIDCLKTRKDPQPWIDEKNFLQLESNRKTIQSKTEEFRSQLNKLNKQIGINKSKGESAEDLMQQAEAIKTEMADNEARLTKIQIEMESILLSIPNLPHPSVPVGKGEADNMEVRRWSPEGGLGGNPKPLPFPIKDHIELSNGDIDFESASKISGSRFAVIKGGTALLHRTLAQMMLNTHISNHGYTECQVPYIVNAETLQGTGQLPKFKEDLFVTQKGGEDQNDLYLIPTSEVPLTNLVREKILKKEDLPIKLTAHTPCFRSEAGSYGKDTKGLIRQHQFDKVEMVQIVHPEQSYAALEEMLNHAERILQKLELPYRVMNLCTADIGFAAAKTYDIEVWIPSQNCYREIASISNCEDFQARRMQARFKNNQGKTEFVHTLNGSGLAVGRTLIALLENHQTEKGDVVIPESLHPYFIGIG